jgi:UDPglucose 6-dehydrogenase
MTIVCIIGLGFVGGSMYKSFANKGMIEGDNLFGYDKYCRDKGTGKFEDALDSNIIFLALPTQYNSKNKQYDKTAIYETCDKLQNNKYNGVIVIKSTVEPSTTDMLSNKYPKLCFIHNPEFLTARTAYHDFHNQFHIVLGRGKNCSDSKLVQVKSFYNKYYENAEVSVCTSLESESMKIFSNCFYAQKVQIFTEYYLLCQKNGCNYNRVKDMMIKNRWINPMHTNVPGPDGNVSYGGLCFPKDTNALLMYMNEENTPHRVLQACVDERNDMRSDHDNCQ